MVLGTWIRVQLLYNRNTISFSGFLRFVPRGDMLVNGKCHHVDLVMVFIELAAKVAFQSSLQSIFLFSIAGPITTGCFYRTLMGRASLL